MEVGLEGCLDVDAVCLLPLYMYPKNTHTHTNPSPPVVAKQRRKIELDACDMLPKLFV